MSNSLDFRIHSEVGLVRSNNQDSGYASPQLLAVADGMGGAAAGDLASSVAISALVKADEVNRDSETRLSGEAMLEVLTGTLARANDSLADLMSFDPAFSGMGTTVCGVMFDGEQIGLVNIGDSRGYLLRDGELTQLTHDHSWVQSLVDEGKITSEEAAEHPHRSLLLKVMNGQANHQPDFELLPVQLGDRLLFCSDGLCGLVNNEKIAEIWAASSLDDVCEKLAKAALDAGGNDNITIVTADICDYSDELDKRSPELAGAVTSIKVPDVIDLIDTDFSGDEKPEKPALKAKNAKDRAEELRYRPELRKRRKRWPILISLLLLIALCVGGFFGGQSYLANQFYIGAENGRLAIYQGIPEKILGKELAQVSRATQIEVKNLPRYYAELVNENQLRYDSLQDADTEIARLGELAERCRQQRAEQRKPGQPSLKPGEHSTASPTKPAPSPSGKPSAELSTSALATPSPLPTEFEDCG